MGRDMLKVFISLIRPNTFTVLSDIQVPDDMVTDGELHDADTWVEENFPGFLITKIQVIALPSNHQI
jgi:hypothetical protein